MRKRSRSPVYRSLLVLLLTATPTACSGSVAPAKSTTMPAVTETSQVTTTVQDVPDTSVVDAETGKGTTLEFDGQKYDIEPTTCKVDDGNVNVVGPGTDHESGDDAHLDIAIKKDGHYSEGTIKIVLGASTPGEGDKVLIAKVGEGAEYSIATYGETADIEVVMKDDADEPAGTAKFSLTCD